MLVEACDACLRVNTEKTKYKYMMTSRNTEEKGNRNITIKDEIIEKTKLNT